MCAYKTDNLNLQVTNSDEPIFFGDALRLKAEQLRGNLALRLKEESAVNVFSTDINFMLICLIALTKCNVSVINCMYVDLKNVSEGYFDSFTGLHIIDNCLTVDKGIVNNHDNIVIEHTANEFDKPLSATTRETTFKVYKNELFEYADWFKEKLNVNNTTVVGVDINRDIEVLTKSILPIILTGANLVAVDTSKSLSNLYNIISENKISHLALSAYQLKQLANDLANRDNVVGLQHLITLYDSNYHINTIDTRILYDKYRGLNSIVCLFGYLEAGLPQCYKIIEPGNKNITYNIIGKSVIGARNFILDNKLRFVPPNVIGDVYVVADNANNVLDITLSNRNFTVSKTGLKARYDADKTIQITAFNAREIFIDGTPVNIDSIEDAIKLIKPVTDCKLVEQVVDSDHILVCFYTAEKLLLSQQLKQAISKILPRQLSKRLELSRVTAMPLTADNCLDIDELKRTSIIKNDVQQAITDFLDEQLGFDKYVAFTKINPFDKQEVKTDLKPIISQYEHIESGFLKEKIIKTDTPAISHGQQITQLSAYKDNLIVTLQKSLKEFPQSGITYINNHTEDFECYNDLFQKGLHVLKGLQKKGLKKGDKVILQVHNQKDFFSVFWGCLSGGIVPLVIAPITYYTKETATANKLYNAWELLNKPIIISSDAHIPMLLNMKESFGLEKYEMLKVSDILASEPASAINDLSSDEAFLLLTSGSTGMPKCIPVSHKSAMAHLQGMQQHININASDVVVNILPIDHITPLLTLHIRAMVTGANQVQINTENFINEPLIWFDAIEKYKGTHAFSPNFAYRLISERLILYPEKYWDLTSVKYFKNGGELVSYEVYNDFIKKVKCFGITKNKYQPAYGMTEAAGAITTTVALKDDDTFHLKRGTLSGTPVVTTDNNPQRVTFMSVGSPIPGVSIRIVNNLGELLSEGEVGIVEVKGDVLTLGYVNNKPATNKAITNGWFNTGDFGFLTDNKLVITGRAKDNIIINGINYYAYEFEQVVKSVPLIDLNSIAACGVQGPANGTESVAIFFVPQISIDLNIADIVKNIRKKVTSFFGVRPAYVIPLDKELFLRTDSGKINHTALFNNLQSGAFDTLINHTEALINDRKITADQLVDEYYCIFYSDAATSVDFSPIFNRFPFLRNHIFTKELSQIPVINKQVDYDALFTAKDLKIVNSNNNAKTQIQLTLTHIWEIVLQTKNLSLNDNFFDLGGNSLKAIQIISRVYKELNAVIEFKDIFNNPTISELSVLISTAHYNVYQSIKPVNEQPYYALSYSQKRLWVLDDQEENHIAYNMPMAYYLNGPLNIAALDGAFDEIIKRHEILRTVFIKADGEPKQKILTEDTGFRLSYADISTQANNDTLSRKLAFKEFTTPFNLEKGPLLRAQLLRLQSQKYLLVFNMHHIISDGWSLKVIFNELVILYNALVNNTLLPLKPLKIQYKDYSAWHNGLLSSDAILVHKNYWAKKLGTKSFAEEVLPLNRNRTEARSYSGNTKTFFVDNSLAKNTIGLTASEKVTPFILLQAILKVLLSKYSGQKQITIGAPVASRGHQSLEGQIGFYLNNLVLLDELDDQDTFTTLLSKVKQTNIEAYNHQLYPYDSLVDDLHMLLTKGRNPFYDVMIVMETDGIVLGEEVAVNNNFTAVEVNEFKLDYTVSKLDLTFFFRIDSEFSFDIEYRTDLFDYSTIKKVAADFNKLLAAVVSNPQLTVINLKNLLIGHAGRKEHQYFTNLVAETINEDF